MLRRCSKYYFSQPLKLRKSCPKCFRTLSAFSFFFFWPNCLSIKKRSKTQSCCNAAFTSLQNYCNYVPVHRFCPSSEIVTIAMHIMLKNICGASHIQINQSVFLVKLQKRMNRLENTCLHGHRNFNKQCFSQLIFLRLTNHIKV